MTIRPERAPDYATIARVQALAFENRASEPAVVALLRQAPSFDPELSLVAEVDDAIVGHALFTPQVIRILDRDVRAVNLAPIAVLPQHQRRGIGRALIEEGHRIGRAKGYALSFLLGHPEYYVRLGYYGGLFGVAHALVAHGSHAGTFESHAPAERYLEALGALWLREEGPVDFAIDPGTDLLGWVSPNPMVECLVWTDQGEVAGYTRVNRCEPASVRMFLARDDGAASALVSALAGRYSLPPTIEMPLHPRSASAAVFGGARCEPWEAGMACPLEPSPLEEYMAELRTGARPPGRPIWPSVFDLA